MKTEVCILGDGIVGRTLALVLADQGLRVGLVQAPRRADSPDVRAYSLNIASKHLLESVRGWPEAKASPVKGIAVFDQGLATVQFETQGQSDDDMAFIVDAAEVEAALNTALDYAPKIQRLSEPVEAQLLVICEGKGRQETQRKGAAEHALHYQQAAIACRLRTTHPHNNWARQWFEAGDVIGCLGQHTHQVSLVWSTSVANAERLSGLSEHDFCTELMAMGAGASHSVGEVFGQLHCDSVRQSWPLKLSQIDHWTGPGWVAAGDAAHTVHPLTGQGLNLGLGDVACLSRCLAERDYWRSLADPKVLRSYERERKAQVMRMSGTSDALQVLFGQRNRALVGMRQAAARSFNRCAPLKDWVVKQAMGA